MFRHIRYKLIAAFALPLLILVAVAGLEVSSATSQMSSYKQESSVAKATVEAQGSVQALVQALQNEREDAVLSVLAAAGNVPSALASSAGITGTPQAVQGATQSALTAFQAALAGAGSQAQSTYKFSFAGIPLLAQARSLWASAVASPPADFAAVAGQLYAKYTKVINDLINATNQIPFQISDPTLRTGVEAVAASLQKTESDWQVTMDLFQASWATKATRAAAIDQVTADFGAEQTWVKRLSTLDTGAYQAAVTTLALSPLTRALPAEVAAAQAGAFFSPSTLLVPSGTGASASTNLAIVAQGDGQIATVVNARAVQLHNNAVRQAGEYGLAGLIGTLLGLLLVSLASRSISRPLVSLAHQADDLASEHLPATLQSMLANDSAGVPDGLPITVPGHDEVSEVARALDAVQKTAIELAAGQVALRRNLSDAFVNLGRRNQNLVTRQLEYISEIELKESDPASLEELFRLDHLATRMRRNAESLLILAGSGPARQWSAAVPAMDVARAASAEVEDYKRLRLHHFDQAMITGEVTTDLVHILAELIENALTFSPPGSPVDVYGRFLEGGYVLVIVDAGIGMSAYDLDVANRRLEGIGSEGEVPGRYLGHFVAGRLASRHGLGISLQASHSGGLVARVRVPAELIEEPVPDLSAGAEVRPAGGPPAATAASATGPANGPARAPALPPPPAPAPSASANGNGNGSSPLGNGANAAASGPDEAWYVNYSGPDADGPADEAGPGPQIGDDLGAGPLADSTATESTRPAAQGPARTHDPYHDSYADDVVPGTDEGADGTGPFEHDLASFGHDGSDAPDAGPDLSDAELESLADNAEAWSAEVSPELPDRSDLLDAATAAAASEAAPEAAAVPAPPAPPAPVPEAPAIELSAPAPGPVARHQGTPDLGILSPLAGTVPAGGLLAFSPPPAGAPPAAPGAGPAPLAAPALAAPAAPAPAPKPTGAAAWNALPVPPVAPGSAPGQQARNTADGLRKLTRRVPGASLPEQDDSLRRTSPTTTTRNPLGLTGALAQYLSATANDGRAEKGA